MKTKILLVLCALFAFISNGYSQNQYSFGVSTGIGFNSAHFGYRMNKIEPYIGFQSLSAGYKYENNDKKWSDALSEAIPETHREKLTANIYVPTIGVKYFAIEHNKLQAYLSLNISKPFVTGKASSGKDSDMNDQENYNDAIQEIHMLGGEFGVGVEYFFDKNFSIGGEFGIRGIHGKYEYDEQASYYNPTTDATVDYTENYMYRVNIAPTYSRISLNFYF